jgi:hypothetical protein
MNPMEYLRPELRHIIAAEFGRWVQNHNDLGWNVYFLSFMFNHLKGNQTGIIRQMQDAVNAFYGKLIKGLREVVWVELEAGGLRKLGIA